jgi:hypothetical protein
MHIPSSPPERRPANNAVEDNDENPSHQGRDDNILSDPNLSGQDPPQQYSLGSRIDETQFSVLEQDTQFHDEPGLSFQENARPLQSTTENMSATTGSEFDHPSFIAGIERPKNLDVEAGPSGFRFGKAQRPPKFSQSSRYHGKPADIDPNANRQLTLTATSDQNPSIQSCSNG